VYLCPIHDIANAPTRPLSLEDKGEARVLISWEYENFLKFQKI